MRLSIHEDPVTALAFRGKIFLDGVEQKMCTTFDTEAGYIERYKEVDGKIVIENDEGVIERLEGVVTVVEEASP